MEEIECEWRVPNFILVVYLNIYAVSSDNTYKWQQLKKYNDSQVSYESSWKLDNTL